MIIRDNSVNIFLNVFQKDTYFWQQQNIVGYQNTLKLDRNVFDNFMNTAD